MIFALEYSGFGLTVGCERFWGRKRGGLHRGLPSPSLAVSVSLSGSYGYMGRKTLRWGARDGGSYVLVFNPVLQLVVVVAPSPIINDHHLFPPL